MFRSCSQMIRYFQPEVVFRMFSIANPTVRLKKDFLGSEARKISKACCPGKKFDPGTLFFIIVLYHAQVSPIPYKSSENTLETLETRTTSKKHDIFMKKLCYS